MNALIRIINSDLLQFASIAGAYACFAFIALQFGFIAAFA